VVFLVLYIIGWYIVSVKQIRDSHIFLFLSSSFIATHRIDPFMTHNRDPFIHFISLLLIVVAYTLPFILFLWELKERKRSSVQLSS
jgi:hypothetical protein